jgi:Flp pilus assembly pilin Flp
VTVRLSILAVGSLAAARDRLFDSLRREDGQTFVEYALVLLVVALALSAAAIWTPLGTAVGNAVTKVSNALNA